MLVGDVLVFVIDENVAVTMIWVDFVISDNLVVLLMGVAKPLGVVLFGQFVVVDFDDVGFEVNLVCDNFVIQPPLIDMKVMEMDDRSLLTRPVMDLQCAYSGFPTFVDMVLPVLGSKVLELEACFMPDLHRVEVVMIIMN